MVSVMTCFASSLYAVTCLPRSDRHSRWISAREALLLQGIPIYKSLSFGKVLCSFAKDDSRITYTGRTATIGQAGNAMHSQCASIVLMYCLTQIDMKKDLVSFADRSSTRLRSSASWTSAASTISQPQPRTPRVIKRNSNLADDDTDSIRLIEPPPSSTGAANVARKNPRSTTSVAQMMWACTRAHKRAK